MSIIRIKGKVIKYAVGINQNNLQSSFRQILLSLESGTTVFIAFRKERPREFLKIEEGHIEFTMTEDEFADVYHLLQSESPVFFSAFKFVEMQMGTVHTEWDITAGETPGEGDKDPETLEEWIRHVNGLESAT